MTLNRLEWLLLLALPAPFAMLSPALADSKFYRCYDQQDFAFCVPSIGQGDRLFAITSPGMTPDLRPALQGIAPSEARPAPLSPDKKAEQEVARDFPGKSLWDVSAYFPSGLVKRFNRKTDFGGPNCYHAALSAAGILSSEETRYVGPEEFELYLKYYFTAVTSPPQPGDILVFNARGARDHAALALFDGLVFHKKGFEKGYVYRIVHVDDVNEKEPFEWQPPLFGAFAQLPRFKDIQAYRRKPELPQLDSSLSESERRQLRVIDFLTEMTLQLAPNWAVGKTLGLVVEDLAADFLREISAFKSSPHLRLQLAYERLSSVRHQLFQSIEETHFASRYASTMREKITEEICVQSNATFRELILLLLQSQGKRLDAGAVLAEVSRYDRKTCRIPLMEIIKRQP